MERMTETPEIKESMRTPEERERDRGRKVFSTESLNALDWIALGLTIIGGLNWGLVGVFNFDLVAAIFGAMTVASRVVYILVGLGALYSIYLATRLVKRAVVTTGLNALDWIALGLAIIGGLNWGLVGVFNFDLVAAILGTMSAASQVVYTIVGLGALYGIFTASMVSKRSSTMI